MQKDKITPLNDIFKEKLIETESKSSGRSGKKNGSGSINGIHSDSISKLEIQPKVFLLKVFDPDTGTYNTIPVKKVKTESITVTSIRNSDDI